jgi:hypothetical protein
MQLPKLFQLAVDAVKRHRSTGARFHVWYSESGVNRAHIGSELLVLGVFCRSNGWPALNALFVHKDGTEPDWPGYEKVPGCTRATYGAEVQSCLAFDWDAAIAVLQATQP